MLFLRWTYPSKIKCQSKWSVFFGCKKEDLLGLVLLLLLRLNAVEERVSIMDTLETSHKMKCGQGSGYQMAWLHMGMLDQKGKKKKVVAVLLVSLSILTKNTTVSSKNTRSIKIDHNNKKEASTLIFSERKGLWRAKNKGWSSRQIKLNFLYPFLGS